MTIFDVLTLIGGLCLFLFGMNVMGESLERRAGSGLRNILSKLTSNKWLGFLTGLAVTGVIQSSSATTVMVVGFVNSGLLSLRQAISVIMGANVGTTITAWILSLSGIGESSLLMRFLKPTSFTPVLALIGIIFYMFYKDSKKKDTGMILLGFSTLMFGMDIMSGAAAGLEHVPAFQQMFVMFRNPILGMLAGACLTAVIQSSSAATGILQVLAMTGQVSYGAAIPIIMGQNIGTCITAMLSSVGANKNARRAALVHLNFNIIGSLVCIFGFVAVRGIFAPEILNNPASQVGIAICHTAFNVACTAMLLPCAGLLEKFVCRLVPDSKTPDVVSVLDERLMDIPAVALERCHELTVDMADCAEKAMEGGIELLHRYSDEVAHKVAEYEDKTDRYEDILGTYLVKLSGRKISQEDNDEAAMLLKAIGDFERISDHGLNLRDSAEELSRKGLKFSEGAKKELEVLIAAVQEIMAISFKAFVTNDLELASKVEPLEQVIDSLKESMRKRHIQRMQQGECSIETGFVWSDLLTGFERVSDHCSNIAGAVIDLHHHDMNCHEALRLMKENSVQYQALFEAYAEKYEI